MEPVPEYTPDELLEKTRSLGFPKYLQDFFEKCIDFHTYPAPGVLIGVFMVDYALATLGNSPRDKIFVTCETQKCLPDPPQVIMHATIGNHRLRVLPIGKFAITLTPSSADENVKGVRVSIDRKKMNRYPILSSWYDNSPEFRPAVMKRQLVDEILAAGRDILSCERIRMKVTPKKRWKSVTCPLCGEQIPEDLMEGDHCAGCGSLAYYEKIS